MNPTLNNHLSLSTVIFKLFLFAVSFVLVACNGANNNGGETDKTKDDKNSSKDGSAVNSDSKLVGFDGVKTSYQGIWEKINCTIDNQPDQDCKEFARINYVWERIEFFDQGSKAALYTKMVVPNNSIRFFAVSTLASQKNLTDYSPYDLSLANGELLYCFNNKNCVHLKQKMTQNDQKTIKTLEIFNSFGRVPNEIGNSIGYCQDANSASSSCHEKVRLPGKVLTKLFNLFGPDATPGAGTQDSVICDNISSKKFTPGQKCPMQYKFGCIRSDETGIVWSTSPESGCKKPLTR